MKKIISAFGLGLGLSLALTFSGVALAEGDRGFERSHGGGGHHMMKRMFSKLDLNEEQKLAIKDLREQMHQSMEDLHEEGERGEFRDQMKAIVQAETFDESAFRDLLAAKQAKKIEFGVIKAKMKNGVWNVLTVEQQEKLETMMEKRGHRHGKREMRRSYHSQNDEQM